MNGFPVDGDIPAAQSPSHEEAAADKADASAKDSGYAMPPEVYLLWQDSPEYRKLMTGSREGREGEPSDWKVAATGGLVAAAVCLLVIAVVWPIATRLPPSAESWRTGLFAFQALLGAIAVVILVAISFRYSAMRRAYYDRVKLAKSRAVDLAVDALRRDPSLENLLVLNRRQLDDYHLSSVRQQSCAFRNAQTAAVIGFAILVGGALLAIGQQNQVARYVAAGLSGLGAALSAYVASVFFQSYRDTSDEMRAYYREPFNTHQVLMIERIAGLQQGKPNGPLREEIVRRLLDAYRQPRHVREAGH